MAQEGTRVSMPAAPGWPGPPPGYGAPLAHEFFARDTLVVAEALLGCLLVSRAGGTITAGRIVETEAYLGSDDPGSHASTRGVTPRNRVMFGPPGHTYVYFTYGNHHMLNLVAEHDGVAGGVLIRAIEPVLGADEMERRRTGRSGVELTNGPGKLAAALGLDLSDNAARLGEGAVAVYAGGLRPGERMGRSGRVGLSAGYELELRRYIEGNAYVSRGRTGPPRTAGRRSAEDKQRSPQ